MVSPTDDDMPDDISPRPLDELLERSEILSRKQRRRQGMGWAISTQSWEHIKDLIQI